MASLVKENRDFADVSPYIVIFCFHRRKHHFDHRHHHRHRCSSHYSNSCRRHRQHCYYDPQCCAHIQIVVIVIL